VVRSRAGHLPDGPHRKETFVINWSCWSDYWSSDLSAAFQFHQLSSFIGYIAIGSLTIYAASFAIGLGPVFWLMISEIYPLKVRGVAMSVATVANWGMNLVVAVTFLTLVKVLGRPETFWLYGVIAIVAWVFFYRLVPETKGKTLKQIEDSW